ncbi:hypothetical protein GCM10023194_54060 [Planotetraspora phitsanulokensis]|uniref:Uncharacterized protein n=1 Tax=Planotetraspora phitsanulokensis TaxID=575192 RepID=A0A8J3UCS1_9ACTN|nr:hypothetical protein [Planotetraspora phitsanulokensis]GII36660.1 hypothetical protein Pph01_16630 [Planotetraspora phitsanulokensis]
MTAADLAKRLPGIATVRALSQSYAVLDALLSPDGYATYSFDAHWASGEELASMNDGAGDEYSIVFTRAGAFIRGFDHESPMSPYRDDGTYATWPGLVESLPREFASQIDEPAFCHDVPTGKVLAATVCLWRLHDDSAWRCGDIAYPRRSGLDDPDGSGWMFAMLADATPEAYRAYAEDYFEVSLDPAAIREVFQHRPLTADLVRRINPEAELASLEETLETVGYSPGSIR